MDDGDGDGELHHRLFLTYHGQIISNINAAALDSLSDIYIIYRISPHLFTSQLFAHSFSSLLVLAYIVAYIVVQCLEEIEGYWEKVMLNSNSHASMRE